VSRPVCVQRTGRRTEIAYNPDYAAAKVAEDARRMARRRTLVLQAPDTKQIRRDWQPLVAPNDEEILYTSIHLKGGLLLEGYP